MESNAGDIDFNLGCWYTNADYPCANESERCKKTCHLYLEMCYMITNCGMPNAEQWIKHITPALCDLEAYTELQKIKENIVEFVKKGSNLYINSGKCGNGKTTWALKLMYKYFDSIWCGNGFRRRGYFLYTADFLNIMKYPMLTDAKQLKRLTNIAKNVDLLIWDDIAVTELTKAEHNILLSIIDYRMQRQKSNIYTGNMLGDELLNAVGSRLYDRIINASKIVTFNGDSMRDII